VGVCHACGEAPPAVAESHRPAALAPCLGLLQAAAHAISLACACVQAEGERAGDGGGEPAAKRRRPQQDDHETTVTADETWEGESDSPRW
jgi:hypothetical protein